MSIRSIADIKSELDLNLSNMLLKDTVSTMTQFIEDHESDQRSGVQKLVERANKTISNYNNELERVAFMLTYERQFESANFIGGIDEAGRGPLAGPVVAACVILDKNDPILFVNDSKKLSAKKREELYDEIISRSVAYGIGVVSKVDIDDINILQATYKAMRIAIDGCKIKPDQLLNDAVIIPGVSIPQEKIIKGDAKSLSIAAASILAKVSRDRIMVAYDELFPEYGFSKNKGYGSADHIQALKCVGASPIHRQSFIKNFV